MCMTLASQEESIHAYLTFFTLEKVFAPQDVFLGKV